MAVLVFYDQAEMVLHSWLLGTPSLGLREWVQGEIMTLAIPDWELT